MSGHVPADNPPIQPTAISATAEPGAPASRLDVLIGSTENMRPLPGLFVSRRFFKAMTGRDPK